MSRYRRLHRVCLNLTEPIAADGDVAQRVRAPLTSDSTCTDAAGVLNPLDVNDILIFTSCNAQVKSLDEALPDFRIGTVNKFQGQVPPGSSYSAATCSAEEVPAGWSSCTA